MIVGIDYGARLAGTTSLAILEGKTVSIFTSVKKKDADTFLRSNIQEFMPDLIAIDAPLSLPKIYSQKEGSDYFYRAYDRELHAMSPMFLGGLTARAVQLKDYWQKSGRQVIEVYPGGCIRARFQSLKSIYKTTRNAMPHAVEILLAKTDWTLHEMPTHWHAFDALICLYIATLYLDGRHSQTGHLEEGVIHY